MGNYILHKGCPPKKTTTFLVQIRPDMRISKKLLIPGFRPIYRTGKYLSRHTLSARR